MARTSKPDMIDTEIAAFDAARRTLEQHHMGKFVVFHGGKLQGSFDTLDRAAAHARVSFPAGTYLIRQVGTDYGPLPASVLYHPVAAA